MCNTLRYGVAQCEPTLDQITVCDGVETSVMAVTEALISIRKTAGLLDL
jgi:hypothetical protein